MLKIPDIISIPLIELNQLLVVGGSKDDDDDDDKGDKADDGI